MLCSAATGEMEHTRQQQQQQQQHTYLSLPARHGSFGILYESLHAFVDCHLRVTK